jgi:hypothetical protein
MCIKAARTGVDGCVTQRNLEELGQVVERREEHETAGRGSTAMHARQKVHKLDEHCNVDPGDG